MSKRDTEIQAIKEKIHVLRKELATYETQVDKRVVNLVGNEVNYDYPEFNYEYEIYRDLKNGPVDKIGISIKYEPEGKLKGMKVGILDYPESTRADIKKETLKLVKELRKAVGLEE